MPTKGALTPISFSCPQCQRTSEMSLIAFANGPAVCAADPSHQFVVAPNSHYHRVSDEIDKLEETPGEVSVTFFIRGLYWVRYLPRTGELQAVAVSPTGTTHLGSGMYRNGSLTWEGEGGNPGSLGSAFLVWVEAHKELQRASVSRTLN